MLDNQAVPFSYAATNFTDFQLKPIPSTNQCMTKANVLEYLNVDADLISDYAGNQLVPRNKIVGVPLINESDIFIYTPYFTRGYPHPNPTPSGTPIFNYRGIKIFYDLSKELMEQKIRQFGKVGNSHGMNEEPAYTLIFASKQYVKDFKIWLEHLPVSNYDDTTGSILSNSRTEQAVGGGTRLLPFKGGELYENGSMAHWRERKILFNSLENEYTLNYYMHCYSPDHTRTIKGPNPYPIIYYYSNSKELHLSIIKQETQFQIIRERFSTITYRSDGTINYSLKSGLSTGIGMSTYGDR